MQPTTKLFAGIAVFLLSIATGSSATHTYNETRTGIVPGACNFWSNACSPTVLDVFFTFGPGEEPHTPTADATCTVTKNEASHGDVVAMCAVDRDDDGWVTNNPAIDTEDDDTDGNDHRAGHSHGGADEYNVGSGDTTDDAFFVFTVPNGQLSNTATGCFAHDTATNAAGIADHAWDDVVVFLGNVAGGVPYAGTANVELTLTDRSTDC